MFLVRINNRLVLTPSQSCAVSFSILYVYFFFEWFCVSNEQSGVELGLGILYFYLFLFSPTKRKLRQHCVDFEYTCDFMLKLKHLFVTFIWKIDLDRTFLEWIPLRKYVCVV